LEPNKHWMLQKGYWRRSKGVKFEVRKNKFCKIYNKIPLIYSPSTQYQRFKNEVKAINILKMKNCPFLPDVKIDMQNKKIIFNLLSGPTLKECLEKKNSFKNLNKVINDIIKIDRWLIRKKVFLTDHNIKDFIYHEKKLFLIDYESFSKTNNKNSFLKSFQYDLLLRYSFFDKRKIIFKNKKNIKFLMYFFVNYKYYLLINIVNVIKNFIIINLRKFLNAFTSN